MLKMQKRISVLLILLLILIIPSESNASELYYEYCTEIGAQYGIAPELLQAIIYVESRGDSNARSNAGAVGLCQIIPKWHSDRMDRLGVNNLSDPYSNILVCADYISELRYEYGDLYAVLNAYNTGTASYEESAYAKKVCDKAFALEELNGKHNY